MVSYDGECPLLASYCGKYPHTSEDKLLKTLERVGEHWRAHYGMLFAAADGCVQCVQHYHQTVGCASDGNTKSVWSGSSSDPFFNAWRSTFENQSAETLQGQESVREYLRHLKDSGRNIRATQDQWKRNKVWQRYQELLVEAKGTPASSQSHDNRWQRRKTHEPLLVLERIEEPGSVTHSGVHREAQSEPLSCLLCSKISCGSCYVIYLGPFLQDVAVPGLECLTARITAGTEYIKACKSCTEWIISICESHMREIQLLSLECRGVWGPTPPDVSLQRLDKARVLILAQLKRQCADLLQ